MTPIRECGLWQQRIIAVAPRGFESPFLGTRPESRRPSACSPLVRFGETTMVLAPY